jgi:hypothetical protein
MVCPYSLTGCTLLHFLGWDGWIRTNECQSQSYRKNCTTLKRLKLANILQISIIQYARLDLLSNLCRILYITLFVKSQHFALKSNLMYKFSLYTLNIY